MTRTGGLEIRMESIVVEGVPFRQITETARFENRDLIVVNLHSKSAVERAFLGSTAERVIRAATVPVLSVPLVGERTRSAEPAAVVAAGNALLPSIEI